MKMFDAGKTSMIGLQYSEKITQCECFKPFSSNTVTLRTYRRTDRTAISISRVSVLTRDKKTPGSVLGEA